MKTLEKTVPVKLLTGRCGHRFDDSGRFVGQFVQAAGAVVDLEEKEAERYINRGLAEPAPKQPASAAGR